MWVTKRDKARGSDEIIMRVSVICACTASARVGGYARARVCVCVCVCACVRACVCMAMAAGVAAMEGYGVSTRRVKVPPGC